MTTIINGVQMMDRGEIWSVKRTSTDGVETEVACPEGEDEARLLHSAFGGKLWKRIMYVTEGEEVSPEPAVPADDLL